MAKKEVGAPESTVKRKRGRPRKKNVEEAPQMTPEQEMQERIGKCNEEITAVLQKYSCDLEANVLLRPGMVIPQIRIVPVELLQREMQQRMQPPQQPNNTIVQP